MDIVAALFIDDIQLRQVPGPSTRIDLTGVQFSAVAPTELCMMPATWGPSETSASMIVSSDSLSGGS